MSARTISLSSISYNTESHSALQSFWLGWGQTVLMTPIFLVKLKKANIKSHQQYKKITYSSSAYRTQSSILFCCTETNNIFRAVSSSEDAVFSMRTFTWSWTLPISGVCRSAQSWALNRSTLWHKINQHLPSKQTSARGGKAYPYKGFLNFLSTCSSAFRRLTSSSWSIL
jgi:hypothetical protein